MINIIQPIAGLGSRFVKEGYSIPKPIINLRGYPMVYWSVRRVLQCFPIHSLTFVSLVDHERKYKLTSQLRQLFPNASFIILDELAQGPVLTCLNVVETIDNLYPVLFNDCDHVFYSKSFSNFLSSENFDQTETEGAIVVFQSKNPDFSYCEIDSKGYAITTAEKTCISSDAICGAYAFKNIDVFQTYADLLVSGGGEQEYFFSHILNVMLKHSKKIRVFRADLHVPFGDPKQLELVENNLDIKL